MTQPRSRRAVLGASAAAVAGLAGCSSLSLSGGADDERTGVREWLYDPTAFSETPALSVQFEAPARIDEDREQLHPDVRARQETPIYAEQLAPAVTDWALRISDDLLQAPLQTVYSGDFDNSAARAAASAAVGDGLNLRPADDVAGLNHRSNGDGAHVASRDGLAVAVRAPTPEFVRLIEGAADGTDRLDDAGDALGAVLDALGFGHAVAAEFSPKGDGWLARGTGYRVDGEVTTVRLVILDERRSAADLRGLGESIDGLREVSVATDGPVVTLSAVADTDRVGLRGSVFGAYELPYG
jgi:hypothetical protein